MLKKLRHKLDSAVNEKPSAVDGFLFISRCIVGCRKVCRQVLEGGQKREVIDLPHV
jgi:hypothetical protein